MSVDLRIFRDIRLWAGLLLVVFQYWILIHPQPPLVDRPVHLVLALLLVFLWNPLHAGQAAALGGVGHRRRDPCRRGRLRDLLLAVLR